MLLFVAAAIAVPPPGPAPLVPAFVVPAVPADEPFPPFPAPTPPPFPPAPHELPIAFDPAVPAPAPAAPPAPPAPPAVPAPPVPPLYPNPLTSIFPPAAILNVPETYMYIIPPV